jgi:hypothetical protein
LDAAKAVLAFVDRLRETRGETNTVQYLKEALRVFQKAVAGQPVRGVVVPAHIGIDKRGYPKMVPRELRRPATLGEWTARTICVLLLSLYREIKIPGTLKLWTITSPAKVPVNRVLHEIRWDEAVARFVGTLTKLGYKVPSLDVLVWRGPHLTSKAGPNGRAMLLSHLDALALVSHPRLWEHFRNFIAHLSFDEDVDHLHPAALINKLAGYARTLYGASLAADLRVAKVSAKEEAGGKVRVFAIPDYWTQSVLKPLHSHLYEILRLLPTDSTFNQQAGVERAQRAAARGVRHFWSFDLSAATDRFPLLLQQVLISKLFADSRSKAFAGIWANLLVDRDYILDSTVQGYLDPKSDIQRDLFDRPFVRYACGQPMGAYSSWATFALAHHCCVQLCAHIVSTQGFLPEEGAFDPSGWYMNYSLLGDDIVLWGDDPFSAKVAETYLWLMNLLGVEINLEKSLVSQLGVFEFAKNLVAEARRITVFHWKEWDRAFASEGGFVEFIKLMIHRGVVVTPSRAVLTWLLASNMHPKGSSWKAKRFLNWPETVRNLVILLFSPVGAYPMTVKSWCHILTLSVRDMGATNVAWCEYPWVGKHVACQPEDHALIVGDENHFRLRRVLWELWEKAAIAIAEDLANSRLRHYEIIKALLEDVGKRSKLTDRVTYGDYVSTADLVEGYRKRPKPAWLPRGEVLEALVSIHPFALQTNRILRMLWRERIPYIYAEYAESGMQSHDWWIGEDLPYTPGEISRMRAQRQTLPIESYLDDPTREVRAVSEPLAFPKEDEEVQARFMKRAVLKAHKALVHELGELARLTDLHEQTRQRGRLFQPTTPSTSRVITTSESFELYRKAYGYYPWEAPR